MKTILLENIPKNKLLKDKDRDNVFWAQDGLDKNGRAVLVLRIVVGRVSIDIFEVCSLSIDYRLDLVCSHLPFLSRFSFYVGFKWRRRVSRLGNT